jgi:hypothetical protein
MKNNRMVISESKRLQNSDFKCSLFLLQTKLIKSGARMEKKKGKLLISHRYNCLPLLPSDPGGVQQELVV